MEARDPVEVVVALGSNLGDRGATLDLGVALLRSLAVNFQVEVAPVMETAPVDCPPGSPPFLNTVAIFRFVGNPLDLLRCCRALEGECGRPDVHERNAPRPLDLDLVCFGDCVMNTPELILPHPRATQRRFVLEPLAALRPHLVLPGHTATVSETLARL
jgi:2-amino-4-hydroxy-6-hydroxymethyldihydropteridine diphosphokinase